MPASIGMKSVSGNRMISVFCALKPGRMPTMVPRIMPGRITHHSATERPNNSTSSETGMSTAQPPIPKAQVISHSTGPCGSRLLTRYISST